MRSTPPSPPRTRLLRQPRLRHPRRRPRHLPVGAQRLAPERRLDDHPATGQEHAARPGTDRRTQDQRGLPGHGADAPLLQGPDPRDVHERDLVRQSRLRHRGRRRDVLRQTRARADAGRGLAAGRPAAGAVVLRPVHQPARGEGTPELRARADGPDGRDHRRSSSRPRPQRRSSSRPRVRRRHRGGAALRHLRPPAGRSSSSAPRRCTATACRSPPASTSTCSTWPRARPRRTSPTSTRATRPTRRWSSIQPSTGEILAMLGLGRLRRREHRRPGQRGARPAPAGLDAQAVHVRDRVRQGLEPGHGGVGHPDHVSRRLPPERLRRQVPGPDDRARRAGAVAQHPGRRGAPVRRRARHDRDRPPVRHPGPARSGSLRSVGDARRRRSQAARPDLRLLGVRQRRPAGRRRRAAG